MQAVSDTGPLNYLVWIGLASLLNELFETVLIPDAVFEELSEEHTPAPVRALTAAPPGWLRVGRARAEILQTISEPIHRGERAVIALALHECIGTVLIDDRAAVTAAIARGFEVTGTLGILIRAAKRGRVDLAAAFDLLGQTSFHWPDALRTQLLAKHGRRP